MSRVSRSILLVSTILLFSVSLKSQNLNNLNSSNILTDTRTNIKHQFGVKAGLNSTKVRFQPTVEQNSSLGLILGVAYGFMSGKAAGVVIEVLYAQYGWDEKFDDNSMNYSRKMSYMDVPVLSNFIIGRRNGHLKLNLGPRVSFLLQESEQTNILGANLPYYYGRQIEKNLELGLTLGAGYSRVLPAGEIQFDIRFGLTFSNLFETPDDLELLYSQNQGIGATLTYWLRTK